MKRSTLLLLAILLSSATVFGQQSSLFLSLGKPLATKKVNLTSGSPYLNDEFKRANVVTTGGKELKDLPLRHDMLNQRIEYSLDNTVYDITDSVSKFDMGMMDNHTGKFVKMKSGDMENPGFAELVYADKESLYKLNSIKVTSEEDFYTKRVTKKYEPNATYYLWAADKFTKIGSSKKDLLNTFKANDEIKKDLKSSDFDINSDESLMQLAKLINHQGN